MSDEGAFEQLLSDDLPPIELREKVLLKISTLLQQPKPVPALSEEEDVIHLLLH